MFNLMFLVLFTMPWECCRMYLKFFVRMLERGNSMQMQYEDTLLSSGDLCLKAQFFGVTMDIPY